VFLYNYCRLFVFASPDKFSLICEARFPFRVRREKNGNCCGSKLLSTRDVASFFPTRRRPHKRYCNCLFVCDPVFTTHFS
jgi:hypothetical protein